MANIVLTLARRRKPALSSVLTVSNRTLSTDFLHLIKWKDVNGDMQDLKLYEVLATVWINVSDLIGLDMYTRLGIEQRHPMNQIMCVQLVIEGWLKNMSKFTTYSCTWNGIYKLLYDLDLSTTAASLKEALEADVSSFTDSTRIGNFADKSIANVPPTFSFDTLIRPPYSATVSENKNANGDDEDRRDLTYPGIQLNSYMTNQEKERLKYALEEKSKKMICKFSYIRQRFGNFLRKNGSDDTIANLKGILYDLIEYPPLFHNKPNYPTIDKDLDRANSINDIKRIINSYSSFFNFELLEIIFDQMEYKEGMDALELHKKDIAEYAKDRIYHFPSGLGIKDAKHIVVAVKLDNTYEGCTISHLITFHKNLCQLLEVTLGQFPLDGLQPGCICIIFHLPEHLRKIFPLTHDQISELKKLRCFNAKILKLSCEDLQYELNGEMDKEEAHPIYSDDDSGEDYVDDLSGTTPPKSFLTREQIGENSEEESSYAAADSSLPHSSLANSDAHVFSFEEVFLSQRRCSHKRKQFYRHFVKKLKYCGIRSVASRLEPPGNNTMSVFQSHHIELGPLSSKTEKIWLEIRSKLQNFAPYKDYEEWLFFNKNEVERVLRKFLHFCFTGVGAEDSVGQANIHGRPFHSKLEESSYLSFSLGGAVSKEHSSYKMNDCEYLSLVQQKALSIVTKLLKELDEVESLYINREKMGSVHNVYVTKFFKRRVCALILWQKITHGLADNLSRLSNRLGTDILLPDVCKDPPPSHSTPGISYPTSPSSSAKTVVFEVSNPLASVPHTQPISANSFLHQIHDEAGISSESGLASPSPLSPSFLASFNVGSPVGEKFDLSESRHSTSDTTEQAMSSSSKYFDSSILQRRTVHQMSVLEPYKEFVSGDLKRTGIYKTLKRLKEFMKSVLTIAKYAMGSPLEEDQLYLNEEDCGDQKPLHKFMNPELIKRLNDQTHEIPSNLLDRSTSIDAQDWIQEFNSMELPPFTMQYIQLVHVPLDVIQECLKLQSEPIKKLQDHSSHNEKQLADECREILEHAIDVQEFYRENMGVVVQSQPEKVEQVEEDMEAFGVDMKNVLKVYLQYLKKWVSLSSGHILEEEWRKVKTICTSIRGGEAEAGKKFCGMVTQLLSYMGDDLDVKIDDCYSKVIDLEPKDLLMMSCREFKKLFVDVRKHVNRVLCFAKILIKDLEIAADFEISTSLPEFFSVLKSSDHVRVIISHQRLDKMIFVPESITDSKSDIQQLLNVGFAHDRSQESNNPHLEDSYILLLNVDMMDSQSSWTGKTIEITATAETIINLLELQVDSLKMVVSNSSQLTDCRNSFMRAVNRSVTLCNERTSSHENVAERILDLKMAACELAKRFMETPSKVMEYLNIDDTTTAGYHINSYRNTMHTCFNLGFEYVREVFRLLGDDMAYRELGEPALEYIITWIKQFVLSKCESGRGTQPRWASVGLEFMVVACAPTTLASISQNKFESVRNLMNSCVDHVIGEAPTTTSLLATHGALEQTSFSSNPITPSYATPTSYSGSFVRSASSTARSYYFQSSTQSSSSLSTGTYSPTAPYSNSRNPTTSNGAAIDRIDIIRQKIQKKEEERQLKLIELNQIGKVMDKTLSSDKETKLKKLRLTNFEWKLGRKLGQGSFSTVYECLNLTTGEINAVQQVSLQDEDPKDIETIIEGIENLQKVRSEYIIKFYGAEVLHNKLYMFMEYCNEGTLWMIAQLGLTEQMIRHYTRDILKAVDAIHTSNIVHRDIKGTNIFLSSNGSIKLGDFGQSVQLQNFKNTNEMQQAGTIPYMSPEIILKGKMGKPMDIWAVGCVVIEMATGKLPWSEYKEPFAIMYRLGSGERPSIPRAALSQEGHRFLDKCLMFDVDKRPTAIDLFNDPFVKVND